MTLADLRGIKGPTGEGAAEHAVRGERHPGPMEYVQIGVALALITLAEVAVYYIDAVHDVLIPVLLALSATKFSLVGLWFMHLRFDSRVFTTLFVGGLALAVALFVAALSTLGAGLV
ncbi:MAG TPA: cytochrome C oxidase subunit IV family protein [Dehalococcoidia bacterium]|nr:cytochrome C oxidase subunit IV family protein [Dehalococcoidia bacterium]